LNCRIDASVKRTLLRDLSVLVLCVSIHIIITIIVIERFSDSRENEIERHEKGYTFSLSISVSGTLMNPFFDPKDLKRQTHELWKRIQGQETHSV
jgi:hypothetical protein